MGGLQIVLVRHGAEESIHPPQQILQDGLVSDIDLQRPGEWGADQAVHAVSSALGKLQVLISYDDPGSIPQRAIS